MKGCPPRSGRHLGCRARLRAIGLDQQVDDSASRPRDRSHPAIDADAPKAAKSVAPQPHYVVVVNSNAGSSSKFSEEALKAASPDATFEILSVAPEGLERRLRQGLRRETAAVIVVGGDGTARTAAVRAVAYRRADHSDAGRHDERAAQDHLRAWRHGPRHRGTAASEAAAGSMSAASRRDVLPLRRLRLRWPDDAPARSHALRTTSSTRIRKALARPAPQSIGPSLQCRVRWRTPNDKWRNAHSLIVAIGDLERILTPDTEDHGQRLEVAALKLRSVWQMLSFGAAFLAGAWREVRTPEDRPRQPGRGATSQASARWWCSMANPCASRVSAR